MRKLILLMMMLNVMSITAWASEINWEGVEINQRESILLEQGVLNSLDESFSYARGDILSLATLEISNLENGNIYIGCDTYAHRDVDVIYQTVFLDKWDETDEDWIQVGCWDFVRTKEEVGGSLSQWMLGFTLTGYEVDKYYRVRGLHGVELDGVVEAKSTRTDGVLITDEPV